MKAAVSPCYGNLVNPHNKGHVARGDRVLGNGLSHQTVTVEFTYRPI